MQKTANGFSDFMGIGHYGLANHLGFLSTRLTKKHKPVSTGRRFINRTILNAMKLTFLLLTVALLNVHARVASQSVTLSGTGISLKRVFEAIEKQTGYVVFSNKRLMEGTVPVSVTATNMPLKDFLDITMKGQPLNFMIADRTIILSPKASPSATGIINNEVSDNTLTLFLPITGVVRSSGGEPLAGASVKIKGISKGVYTDNGGKFSLPAEKGQIIVISYTGYNTKEITVADNVTLAITLDLQNQVLDEIVVGYGSVRKKDVTGSVSQVNVAEMQKQGAFSLDVALAGQAAGVMVVKSSGAPGADASIRIRGSSSIFGVNEPLYVIDGVPIQIGQGLGSEAYRANKSFQLSPLSAINPDDIESIDILKDASGTAIYGSRGANGVVLVNTKKGKGGTRPTVNIGYNASVDAFVKDFEMLNTDEFVKVVTEAYKNTPIPSPIPANFPLYPGVNTDWKKLVTRKSYSDAWNVSLRGGSLSNETIYSISASTNNERGVIKNTSVKRYSIRGNMESQVVKMFKLGANFSYTNNNTDGMTNTFYYNVISYRPDIPVFDANGRYAATLDSAQANPVSQRTYINKLKNENLMLSAFGELRPFEFLRLRSTISYNKTDNTTVGYTPGYDVFEFKNKRKGSRKDIENNYSSVIFDNTITFNKFIKKHYFNAVAGNSFTSDKGNALNIESVNFPDDFVLNNLGSAGAITKYETGGNVSGLESYFFRANYNYDSKYYFTFTSRNDKSTKFGPNNQRAFFPSAAVAWRASKENFLRNKSWISDVKVRASYGKTGIANLTDFLYASYFSTLSSAFYNGQSGVTIASAPNPSLRWETTTQSDFGIDFALFNSRVRGAIDIYRKYTKDVLLNVSIPFETGFQSQFLNLGDLSNRGIEVVVGGDVVRGRNFTYTSDINISLNKSRLEKLNSGFGTDLKEGDELGTIRGYKTAGIFQKKEDIAALNAKSSSGFYQSSNTAPGDLKFTDQNNDGFVSAADVVKLGSSDPDFFGGWNNVLRYKGLETSVLFYFSYGQLLQNQSKVARGIYTSDKNYDRTVLDAWTPENTNTDHPRNVKNDPNNNARTSDYFIQKGSFFKLKNLQIAYYLNTKRFTGDQVNQIKVFASASNLFILTGYDGVDPEVSTSLSAGIAAGGYDSGSYPSTRTFSVGINVTL